MLQSYLSIPECVVFVIKVIFYAKKHRSQIWDYLQHVLNPTHFIFEAAYFHFGNTVMVCCLCAAWNRQYAVIELVTRSSLSTCLRSARAVAGLNEYEQERKSKGLGAYISSIPVTCRQCRRKRYRLPVWNGAIRTGQFGIHTVKFDCLCVLASPVSVLWNLTVSPYCAERSSCPVAKGRFSEETCSSVRACS